MASSKDLPGTVTSELPGQLGKFVPFTGAIVNIMMILMMIRDVGIRGHCLEYKLIFDTVLLCLRYIRFILSHHITEIHINIYAHTLYHASEARPSPSLSTGHPPGCFVFQVWHGPEAYQGSHPKETWLKIVDLKESGNTMATRRVFQMSRMETCLVSWGGPVDMLRLRPKNCGSITINDM